MTRIVVGIDGSPPADAALAFAVQEARHQGLCPLAIVHSASNKAPSRPRADT
jgi:nucleotide-binding universal stress UspA family protein